MNIFIETCYFSINLLLLVCLFIWPSTSDFNLKNWLLNLCFLAISAACFFWNRALKKNPALGDLPRLRAYPILRGYVESMRIDLGGWFPFVTILMIVKPFFFDMCLIPSGSMQPTFWEGDRVLINRCRYGLRLPQKRSWRLGGGDPQRGEIICFFPPTGTKSVFIKRVIGVSGDRVKVKGNAVMVLPKDADESEAKKYLLKVTVTEPSVDHIKSVAPDITPLKEENGEVSYFIQNIPTPSSYLSEGHTWEVPEGHYFVMGDNRNNSEDSRSFGVVPRENIIATPMLILWNARWMNDRRLPTFHWGRFFRSIR